MTHFKTAAQHDGPRAGRGWRAEHAARHRQVWEAGVALANDVYACTAGFPATDEHVLAKCMRQAALAVPGQIASGAASGSDRDEVHALMTASGALKELDTYCTVAADLGFLAGQHSTGLKHGITQVASMLRAYIDTLNRRIARATDSSRTPGFPGFDLGNQ